jgi:DNA-binding MarR family transcriptional regulator
MQGIRKPVSRLGACSGTEISISLSGKCVPMHATLSVLLCGMNASLFCSCHRLRRAGRVVTRLYEHALADSGLTPQQFAVLASLAYDGARTASELTERVGAERSTLTRAIDRLEAAGLVETGPAGDRRERRVALTGAGRERLAQGVAGWRRAEGTMRHAMGPERVALLWELLSEAEAATTQYDPDKARRARHVRSGELKGNGAGGDGTGGEPGAASETTARRP